MPERRFLLQVCRFFRNFAVYLKGLIRFFVERKIFNIMFEKDLYDGGFVEALVDAFDRLDSVEVDDHGCFVDDCDGSPVGRVVCSSIV
jgi:hypothetical protein